MLIMKKIICVLLTAVLIVPAVSFAQTSNGPVTRAEVRAELVQLERAGYQPAAKQIHYPDEIQAAEQRVQASNNAYASASGAQGSSTVAAATASPRANAAN
jgi:D-alanine-D-alanine ligase-like ATP-grasp enzyme